MKNYLSSLLVVLLFALPFSASAQAPNLRSVSQFTLFTTTGAVSNAAVSDITGKIGTNAGAFSGFTFLPAQDENGNSVTLQAAADLLLVHDEIYSADPTHPNHAAILGNGEILYPGVYLVAEAGSIEGDLVLDAQGDANAIFIIKILGAFSPGPLSRIILAGGTLACNVFWVVEGGAIAMATLSEMKGNFIANPGAVSMAAGSSLEGRLLSTTGAIAVDGVIANQPLCVVLPVTLLDFTANRKNETIELAWTVSNESDFSGYELERSLNGTVFQKIGSVNPAGTVVLRTYTWIDRAPFTGINFYRLKMVDRDHHYKFSAVLKVNTVLAATSNVYPNPVEDRRLTLRLQGHPAGGYGISLYNVAGEKMMSRKIIHAEIEAAHTIVLANDLPLGIYVLQLVGPGGTKEIFRILVK